jgi:hypothetical protein
MKRWTRLEKEIYSTTCNIFKKNIEMCAGYFATQVADDVVVFELT